MSPNIEAQLSIPRKQGPGPGQVVIRIKHRLGIYLRKAQDTAIYKRLVRCFDLEVVIKEASPEDLRDINKRNKADIHQLDAIGSATTLFVAKGKDKIVGYVYLVRYHQAVPYEGHWLSGLRVNSSDRRRGIGESLSQAVIDRARSEGAGQIALLVFEDNQAAVRLYHKLGFTFQMDKAIDTHTDRDMALYGSRRVMMVKKITCGHKA
jgi:ribosomal protein S18 acetylase RimI-like enzyme